MRQSFRVGALLLWFVGTALAAQPLRAGLAEETRATATTLRQALDQLNEAPNATALDRAERALKTLNARLDTYFHAENLRAPEMRPHAIALRLEIHRLLAGPRPLVTLHHDVLRYRPKVHLTLAHAARALGRFDHEATHLRAALAVTGPRPKTLKALIISLRKTGQLAAAAHYKTRLDRYVSRP